MKIFAITSLIITLFLSACIEEPQEVDAKQLEFSEVQSTLGYGWFDGKREEYPLTENQKHFDSIVNEIKNSFEIENQRFIIFSRPSCSCEDSQVLFPYTTKVLISSGIDEQSFEIFSMSKASNNHKYDTLFKVTDLPSVFLIDNDNVYSILDTMNSHDIINEDDFENTIEDNILRAIKYWK